ncbi:MAG: peptidoglycan-binding protein LysM [Pseudomonadota bacterium]
MDLFGFAKDIGRRLFNTDEDAAEKIKEHIEENNPGVTNLEVTYENGIVNLSGQCDSKQARQKCILMAGNTKGVIDVFANELTSPPPEAAVEEATTASAAEGEEEKLEYYIIESGDTLSKIAKRYYGDAMQYPRIFEANREVIQDPDRIFVGQKIMIPLD